MHGRRVAIAVFSHGEECIRGLKALSIGGPKVKRIFVLAFSLVIFPVLATAQQPTPQKDDEVVKISTDLIQIDVTVTDKTGKVVTGLKADDFEVFENGQRQKLSNFSFASKTAGGAAVGGGASPNTGQTVPAATADGTTTTSIRRTIAIVVDDLNLSFASVYYTRRALKRFVDRQMETNDLVAIIRTGGGVGALQQFTSDKRILHAAIEQIKWNPLGAGGIEALTPVSQDPQDITERFTTESDYVVGNLSGTRRATPHVRKSITDVKATDYNHTKVLGEFAAGAYAQASMASMKYIVSGMNDLPGRKIMMLFSDGFAIRNDANKSRTSTVYAMLQDLVDHTNRSSVVVYTFDTRGMQTMSIAASDNTYEVIDGHREQKQLIRLDEFKKNQDSLAYFAGQTGGKALLDSNDLNGGIQRALDEQSGYYLIGYVPDSDTFDAAKHRFNKLEVKVNRPGVKVSYRSGFFNTSSPVAAATAPTVERKMAAALTSPFASNEIAVNVNALYADDPADGAYIRSFLHIDAKNLTFTDDTGGWKKAKFDVAAVTFGDNGVPVDKKESEYTIKTKGATYDTMLRNGFVYVLIMPIKGSGLMQFRAAVRDSTSGKIGSASQVVDIPDLSKKKLTLSTIAVENVNMSTWQLISQGKVGSGPGQTQLASSLLYDTVLKQFQAGTVLRYGYEVYNASNGSSQPDLETQTRILQNNKAVVEGTVTKFNASGQPDLTHIKISGAMMLKDTLAPGDYVLQVAVTDRHNKRVATQQFPFEIVK